MTNDPKSYSDKAFVEPGVCLAAKDHADEEAYLADVEDMFREIAIKFPGITHRQLCRCWDRCCDLAQLKDHRDS
jgi:hypothetical protein